MEQKPSFASNSNWADDVEAEEAELGQGELRDVHFPFHKGVPINFYLFSCLF